MYLEGQSTKARVAVHGHVPTMHDMGLGWVTDILNISEFFFWEFELVMIYMLVCDGLFKIFGIVCFRHVNRNFGIKERSLNR